MNDKVIYTCITGNYDSLMPQPQIEGYDYVCFTDNTSLKSDDLWEVKLLPESLKSLSAVKQQRYVKLHPHEFLAKYKYSIWIDANVKVLKDPSSLFKEEFSVQIPKHPVRNCIYDEKKACFLMKKDKNEIMEPQMERYRAENYPKNNGLVQTNIIFRKHNEEDCIRLMEAWWDEIEKGSHRDQLSFNYALWKNADVRFDYMHQKTCQSEYFNWLKKHGFKIQKPSLIQNKTSEPLREDYKWLKRVNEIKKSKELQEFLQSH